MKIGSKELLDKVKQPKQLELFPSQITLIEKFYMDYVSHISEQINKNMQIYMDMALLQPVHSKTLWPSYEGNLAEFMKSHPAWKPQWNENRYDKATGISMREYYEECYRREPEYAADPTV